MNFDALSGNRRSRRLASVDHAPAMIESLETRALLAAAGPAILSPSGTITTDLPFITWQPSAGATSYDLWIADSETRERIVFKEGIPGTSTTLTGSEALHLGTNRLWVRATLANGTKTDWGAPKDLLLKTIPTITGPTNPANPANPNRIERNDWAITWNSPVGAKSFDVFLSNQTEQTSTRYTVQNQVALLDAMGNKILDGAGNPILQEVRSLYLNGAVDVVGAAPMAVTGAINRTFIDITSENHGLMTGQRVRVSGVQGNTGANGDFTVTVISENVFRLDNAVSSGTYTTGGSWIRLVGNSPAAGATSRLVGGLTASKAIDVTVANHGLKTGEKVRIAGVGGNTAANGTFLVTVVSANVVRLNGVAGTTTFTQNGQLVKLTALQSKLDLAKYRVFVRYTDDAGRVSDWSTARDFEMTPVVNILRPKGPTFETQPLLQWAPVSSATHYQVEVYRQGQSVPVYTQPYLTTTSYRIPDVLTADPVKNFEFRVRAFRLHQVTTITPSGSPASGTFVISLTTTGKTPVTVNTTALSYNATAANIQSAIRILSGFENVRVLAQGDAPNTKFLLEIPLTGNAGNPGVIGGNPVTVSVSSSVTPGTVTSSTVISPRVDGQWSPLVAFSTIQKPVVTGPIGIDTANPNDPRTVTDLRPTITWTAIDRAARYEVWVERSASTSTYLRTTSSVNSYKLQADLLTGNYTVRVRAISTTGQFTDWSNLFAFTATAGATVVQPVSVSQTRRATVTWAAVAEAVKYEVQIAWIGVNIDYLHPKDITVLSYTTSAALSPGNYRVWVRGVKADGTLLNWSKPVDFTVTAVDSLTPSNDDTQLLTVLESMLSVEKAADADSASSRVADQVQHAAEPGDAETLQKTETESVTTAESVPSYRENAAGHEDPMLIEQLAQACVKQEWWTAADVTPA